MAVACPGVEERDFGGFSHYSVRDLARLVEGRGEILTMSSATVQRILAALVLKPHRLRYFLTRTDPEFEVKFGWRDFAVVVTLDILIIIALFFYTRIKGAP